MSPDFYWQIIPSGIISEIGGEQFARTLLDIFCSRGGIRVPLREKEGERRGKNMNSVEAPRTEYDVSTVLNRSDDVPSDQSDRPTNSRVVRIFRGPLSARHLTNDQ